jgi:signal transduction histidine kinase
MHDVLAHSLGVIVVQAEAADDALGRDPGAVHGGLQAISSTARQSLAEVRQVLGNLRSGASGAPSLDDLPALLDAYRSAGLDVEFRVTGRPVDVAPEVGATAYLIAREALTNVLRHAAGAPAVLEIRYAEDSIAVEVRDRGPGRAGSEHGDEGAAVGHGLLGIRERAALVSGEVECGDATDGGFRVLARLPRVASVG